MNSEMMTSGMAPVARSQVYTDFNAMSDLRRAARENPDAALDEVARQFEGIFIKMMLKQMREASMGDPIFNSHSGNMYREMFDDQLALHMSEQQGMGLADILVRQMRHEAPPSPQATATPASYSVSRSSVAVPRKEFAGFDSPQRFVSELWPLAEQAADELGTDPQVILAQAALETGWGQHVSRDRDGVSSHNLFNIKADDRWSGKKVMVDTVEFDGPVAKREKAAFRAYDSFEESFRDYVQFLKSNGRYAQAIDHAADSQAFVRELQEAGYATDPRYADKVLNIMRRGMIQQPGTTAVRQS